MRFLRPALLSLALVAVGASAARAQVTTPTAGAPVAVQYQSIAGVNPIGLIPGLLSAEFETFIAPGFAVGVGGSHASLLGQSDHSIRYSWLDAKAKYYVDESTFAGFSVGATAGFLKANGPKGGHAENPAQHKAAFTLGIVGDYNWFLGRTQRLYAGTGIGAKRVFGPTGNGSILNPVFPYARAELGLAF